MNFVYVHATVCECMMSVCVSVIRAYVCVDTLLTGVCLSQCCGTTPYAVEERRVLCCNQTLHRGVEAGHQCSPGGHLYLPSREMVCESHVHLNNPGKHCCGEETYNPKDEICCNGLK